MKMNFRKKNSSTLYFSVGGRHCRKLRLPFLCFLDGTYETGELVDTSNSRLNRRIRNITWDWNAIFRYLISALKIPATLLSIVFLLTIVKKNV